MVERFNEGESINPQNLLKQAIEEYKSGPLTPELVTKYWREKLRVDGEREGIKIEVPDCDWTEEEIQRPMIDIEGNPVSGMMVYVPEEFGGREGLTKLGRMYSLRDYTVRRDTPIANTHSTTGWVKVEATLDAPNCNTSQKDLEKFVRKQRGRYLGQRANVYILAAQAMADLVGGYFDQDLDRDRENKTWTRLLASRDKSYNNSPIVVGFSWLGAFAGGGELRGNIRHPQLGARFEEVRVSLPSQSPNTFKEIISRMIPLKR